MARHAWTFRFACRFFPPTVRAETIQLYAFFRTIDDLVDESELATVDLASVRSELDDWTAWFTAGLTGVAPRPEIGIPLEQVVRTRGIPVDYFFAFLDGMYADLALPQMRTREDVESYSYQVASSVGLSMTHVFGATGRSAKEAARRLGIAMQLTNILRDVGGDLDRGRLYLPLNLLGRHGLEPGDVERMWHAGQGPNNRLRSALAEMVAWADEYYLFGESGVRLLPREVRLPVLLASRLYQQILRELERTGYDSLRTRVSTSRWRKLQMLSTCLGYPGIDGDYAHAGEEGIGAHSVADGE